MKSILTTTMAIAVFLTIANVSSANAFCGPNGCYGTSWQGHRAHTGWAMRGNRSACTGCCAAPSCCGCVRGYDFWGNAIRY
ncbi:MAG TPA: hypothetical protein VMW10_10280 [Alphaproteobacteria bacterium]|nr:hypothetical protein [Alphaproteobacteria bacterium]